MRIFGLPGFIHRGWDTRARRDIAAGDVIVFAEGDEHQPMPERTFDDLTEARQDARP